MFRNSIFLYIICLSCKSEADLFCTGYVQLRAKLLLENENVCNFTDNKVQKDKAKKKKKKKKDAFVFIF